MNIVASRRDVILGFGRVAGALAAACAVPTAGAAVLAHAALDADRIVPHPLATSLTIRLKPLYTVASATKYGHEKLLVELRPPPTVTPVGRIDGLAIHVLDANDRPLRGVRCALERRVANAAGSYRPIARATSGNNGVASFGSISFPLNRVWDLRFSVGGVIVARLIQS
jgi:hypothetical protein